MKRSWIGAIVVVLMLPLLGGCLGWGNKTHLTLQFEDATGLFRGNDVGIRGVPVGQVVSITPAGAYVNVEIEIDGDIKLPKDVGAAIVSRSVATDRYIELTPTYTGGPVLESGATIGVGKTKTPVEFEELLASLEDISNALGAEDGSDGPLHEILSAASIALDGQGATIADGMSDLAVVLNTLSGSMPLVEENLANLDSLTQTLATHDALVRDFVTQVTDATVMLDSQSAQIEATFDAIAAMLQGVADFSAAHKGQIANQIEDFVALAQELQAHETEITQLLQTAPLVTQSLPNAIQPHPDTGEARLRFLTRPISLVPDDPLATICETPLGVLCDYLPTDELSFLSDLLDFLAGGR